MHWAVFFLFLVRLCVSNFNCDGIVDTKGYKYEDINYCVQQVDYQITFAKQTLSAVRAYYDNYVYRDITLDSRGAYQMQVDVLRGLELIESDVFHTDYDFHVAVQKELNLLRDAHTKYVPPVCYAMMTYSLPFAATIRYEQGSMKLIVIESPNSLIKSDYATVYPEKSDLVNKYTGWEITDIHSENAIDFLKHYALNHESYSRDLGANFNAALKYFFDVTGMMSKMPERNYVEFTLRSAQGNESVTFEAPYMVTSQIDVTEYEKQGEGQPFFWICGYRVERRNANGKLAVSKISGNHNDLLNEIIGENHHTVPLIQEKLKRERENKIRDLRRIPDFGSVELENYENLVSTADFKAYYKTGSDIGVFVVPTFMPAKPKAWYNDIVESLKKMKARGVTKLMLDVRGNGGGYVNAPAILSRVISKYVPDAFNPIGDMIQSAWWDGYYCKNNVPRFQWIKEDRTPVKDATWLHGLDHFRGGNLHGYTQALGLDANLGNNLLFGVSNPHRPLTFEPENILILTDGMCGSACGMFVSLFRQLKLARVVAQGGFAGSPLALSSFKGASVLNSAQINNNDIVCRFLCDCTTITEFPGRSMMTFSWYEVYPYDQLSLNELDKINKTYPVEFLRFEPDEHLLDWNFDFNSAETTYSAVEKYYEGCYQWEIQRNDECEKTIPNAVYGNPCIDGHFDTGLCMLRGCDVGYHLDPVSMECCENPKEYPMYSDYQKFLARQVFLYLVLPIMLVVGCVGCCCLCCCAGCITLICCLTKRKKKAEGYKPFQDEPGVQTHITPKNENQMYIS